jgi:hypothetical protein
MAIHSDCREPSMRAFHKYTVYTATIVYRKFEKEALMKKYGWLGSWIFLDFSLVVP